MWALHACRKVVQRAQSVFVSGCVCVVFKLMLAVPWYFYGAKLSTLACLLQCSDQIASCLLKGLGFGAGSKGGTPMQVGVFVYAFFLLERVSRQIICTHSHIRNKVTERIKQLRVRRGG